jgi:hypothetical protein
MLIACGLLLWARSVNVYRKESALYHALADLDQITLALKTHDPDLESKVVMALDPARAYYAGSRYLATPFEYDGSVDGLVSYQGVSPRLKHYAAKYPSSMDEGHLRADYLIYTSPPQNFQELHDPPQFAFLMDPTSPNIPKNFKLIYQTTNAVVYELVWGETIPTNK